jgi:transketolase
MFQDAYPDRFFNVGIAEAGMIDTAVGIALGGKIPFASAFASALCYRGFEQIRTCVAYNNVGVKLLSGYAGISDYKDGPTHHSIIDLAIMRAMPNMTVVVPGDGNELKKMIPAIAEYEGPVYFRVSRADATPVFDADVSVEIGKGRIVRDGSDVTLCVTGLPLYRTLKAAEILESEGISARVVEFHTLKPFDEELLLKCAEETGALVTVEEHSVIGALYGAVAEILVRGSQVPVKAVGIQDAFTCTAMDVDSILDHFGFRPEDIAQASRQVLKKKS